MTLLARDIGRTAQLLLTPGTTAQIIGRFRHGLHVCLASGELVVLAYGTERAPWAVNVPALASISPTDTSLAVDANETLHLLPSRRRIALRTARRWATCQAPRCLASPDAIYAAVNAAAPLQCPPGLVGLGAEPLLQALRAALAAGTSSGLAAAAVPLVGLGYGLTPAGDDLLTGLFGTRALLGMPVPSLAFAGRTTPLAASQLSHALRGELAEPLQRVVTMLLVAHPAAPAAVRCLRAYGHTSGEDQLAGVALALLFHSTIE